MPPVEFSVSGTVGGGGNSSVAPSLPLVGLCLTTEFFDGNGNPTGSRTAQIGTDPLAGPIPPGSVFDRQTISAWEPDDDDDEAQAATGGANRFRAKPRLAPVPGIHRVFGGTLYFTPDEDYVQYVFLIEADSTELAGTRAEELLALGVGAELPPWARKAYISKAQLQGNGDVFVEVASIGSTVEEFLMDFNGTSSYADLANGVNASSYAAGPWVVAETTVRSEDIILGSEPGVFYDNEIAIRFKTDTMPTAFLDDRTIGYQQ